MMLLNLLKNVDDTANTKGLVLINLSKLRSEQQEYKQALDIMKLSFPLTSPSMFRRFGFRWKETMVNLPGNGHNHGRSYKSPDIKRLYTENGIDFKNKYIISHADSKAAGYDALKLAERLDLKI